MTHESTVMTFSSSDSVDARMALYHKADQFNGTEDEKERSQGLFIRGSLLARMLAIGDIYQKIVTLPGMVFDLGTWRGQTAVLCENFRAIHEPLHFNRRIACFDTFDGYKGFSGKDSATALHRDGTYGVGGASYATYLEELLVLHERNNAMGHFHGKHTVVRGDIRETLPRFFVERPHEIVALAFFDLNSYEPTEAAWNALWDRVVPGGIVAFWQLTRPEIPGEARFYTQKVLGHHAHALARSPYYPGLCYLTKRA